MSDQPLEPVYLIGGSDEPKVARALRRLRARFADGSVEELHADTPKEPASGADAVAALNALGLFGGGERLVIVRGIQRWKKGDAEAVVGYLESPTSGATLALVYREEGEKRRSQDPVVLRTLAPAVGQAGSVLRFDVKTRQVRGKEQADYPAWVVERFESAGVEVDREAAERLVELVGDDAFALETEAEKIVAWAAGDPVGIREVEALATPLAETSIFALANAWGARDVGSVLAASEARLRLGDEPFLIAVRLASYIGRVRAVQALVEADVGLREIGQRLGFRFPPRREATHAANYTQEETGAAVVRLAELDFRLKGGSRLDPELELERALVEITASARGAVSASS